MNKLKTKNLLSGMTCGMEKHYAQAKEFHIMGIHVSRIFNFAGPYEADAP